jgi:hypothetical protein
MGAYNDTITLVQLVLAPFGPQDGLITVLGEEGACAEYKEIFKQFEEMLSKRVFTFRGLPDDRVAASIHHFVEGPHTVTVIQPLPVYAQNANLTSVMTSSSSSYIRSIAYSPTRQWKRIARSQSASKLPRTQFTGQCSASPYRCCRSHII